MANQASLEPVLIESIRDAMRRLTIKDWAIFLERLDFGSLMELHRFVLTVEAQRRGQQPPRATSSIECPYCHWGFAPSIIDQHIREKHA